MDQPNQYYCNIFIIFIFRQLKSTTNENQARAADYYDFDFEKGEPTKISKKNNYLWDCAPSKDVPKVYRVCSVKRNTKAPQNCFEGQLPKLRYYHPSSFEKMQQDNNNNSCSGVSKLISVGNSTIIHRTRSGGACQTKITGKCLTRKPFVQYEA